MTYLPRYFHPAPGIEEGQYFKWAAADCTFDGGYVRDKKGQVLAEWYRNAEYVSQPQPACLWFDVPKIEALYDEARVLCDNRYERDREICRKYRDILNQNRLCEGRFCVQLSDKSWMGILITRDGYSVSYDIQPDFQITPDRIWKLDLIADNDILCLTEDNSCFYDKKTYSSIFVNAVLNRFLEAENLGSKGVEYATQSKNMTDESTVATITTEKYKFIFEKKKKYNHVGHDETAWVHTLGPVLMSEWWENEKI